MSTVHNNSRVYTINLIYKFYKTPTTDHYLNETIQKTPINIPNKGTNSFIKKFITKNTHMLREFSKRGIGLIFLTDKTSSVSIKKIKTTNVNIRNNELLVTIDFIADKGLKELMDDQSSSQRGEVDDTSNYYYQASWWNDIFDKEIGSITEHDKIKYIFDFLLFDDVEMFDAVLDKYGLDFFIDHNDEKYYFKGELQNVVHKSLLKIYKRKQKRNIHQTVKITKEKMNDTRPTYIITNMLGVDLLSKTERAEEYKKALDKENKKQTKKNKLSKK